MLRLCLGKGVAPLLKAANQQKRSRQKLLEVTIQEIVKDFGDFRQQIKLGMLQTFYDVHNIAAAAHSQQFSAGALRNAKNIWLTGMIFLNMAGGRPREFQKMLQQELDDAVAKGRDFVIAKDHKTVWKYGPIAKHFPAGNFRACELLKQIPSLGSGLLLEPPSWPDVQEVCATKLLKKCCAAYMPEAVSTLTCTRLRQ